MDQPAHTDYPTGSITFFFSDLEDSTLLWEKYPEVMQISLGKHDQILRDAVLQHGGNLIKTTGDGLHAVFASPTSAALAAITVQERMHSVSWDATDPLQVRIGLHTGEAQYREGDYYGSTVNRASRLMSIGHGGQILLSRATQELIEQELPGDATLEDMGLHALKGFADPEQVYQILIPGLLVDFPPLNSLDIRLTNLPAQTTPFIGRERELAAITDLLERDAVRLVTLTGIGGTGKTRLSLQAAAEVVNSYKDGVHFIDLALITDEDVLVYTIADKLSVKEAASEPILETLAKYLRERQMLLVLDNFEHLIGAVPVVGELIAAVPKLDILVTSREVLQISGEHVYPVPPLGLPGENDIATVDSLAEFESLRLYVERAKAANSAFEVNEENAAAITEICVKLDGLPLAIELAAARMRMFTPQKLLERLSDRLNLLKRGGRDLSLRQQTLRGMIDWSYELLSKEEQKLFARLAIFSGGTTLEAVEHVCAGGLDLDVLDGLESLLDKSLIRAEYDFEGESRFDMLETIYVYAFEILERSDDLPAIQTAHADWFLKFAEEGEQGIFGDDAQLWVRRLRSDEDNFRKVLERCEVGLLDPEVGVRMAGALRYFWEDTGKLSEGRSWLRAMLALSTDLSPDLRVKALCGEGVLAYWQGDWEQVSAPLTEALDIGRQTGNQVILGEALHFLAHAAQYEGANNKGVELLTESYENFRELDHQWGLARSMNCLADAHRLRGAYQKAAIVFDQVLSKMRDQPKSMLFSALLSNLGNALNRVGEYDRAAQYFREGIELGQQLDNVMIIGYLVDGLAGNAALRGRPERAARLLGASSALFASAGVSSMAPADQIDHDHYVAAVRAKLTEETYESLWQDGHAKSLEEIVAYAMEQSDN
jgi:predicted ATPase/class 3 adenylate cyclase